MFSTGFVALEQVKIYENVIQTNLQCQALQFQSVAEFTAGETPIRLQALKFSEHPPEGAHPWWCRHKSIRVRMHQGSALKAGAPALVAAWGFHASSVRAFLG